MIFYKNIWGWAYYMNYAKNRKYFEPIKLKPGVITTIVGIMGLFGSPIVGIILIAVGAGLLYFQLSGRPADDEIDNLYSEMYNGLKEAALKKLGLDEEQVKVIEPVVFGGIYDRNIRNQSYYTTGKDGVVRTSNYQASIFFFGEEQVYYYTRIKSIIEDEIKEETEEYFYSDIVSAVTSSDAITYTDAVTRKAKVQNFEYFKLTTSGGTAIQAVVQDDGSLDKSLNGMKQLLRDKKKQRV